MKLLDQRVIGLELVMNGHLIAKRERGAVLAFQSGLFSWTELAVDFKYLVSLAFANVVLLEQ